MRSRRMIRRWSWSCWQTSARELVLDGRVYTLLELVKQLPDQALGGHPHLLYDAIWALLLTRQ